MNFMWENLFDRSDKGQSTRTALKTNILFQDLNLRELRLVENIVNVRNFRPGENIFKQGEVGVGMYIIQSGSVNVTTEELDASSSVVKVNHVTQLKKGGFFGELALVEDNGRRSASCAAHEEAILVGFFKPDLMELVERNPSAGIKILLRLGEVLGTRLKETTSRLSALAREEKS
jgi:CRP/FNR family transcriptional regulator, cyclic AMP receptor protein